MDTKQLRHIYFIVNRNGIMLCLAYNFLFLYFHLTLNKCRARPCYRLQVLATGVFFCGRTL